jgi:hypothetical protein
MEFTFASESGLRAGHGRPFHATDDRAWGMLVAKAADGRATVAQVRVVDQP